MQGIVFLILLAILITFLVSSTIVRREWRALWHGHEILIRNFFFREQLFIDGKLSDQTGGGFSTRLTGRLRDGGKEIPVLASVHPQGFPPTIAAQLFIDGESIGLDMGRIGHFKQLQAGVDSVPDIPRDSRWEAINALLEAIEKKDPQAKEACEKTRQSLCSLLLEIESLAKALNAHRELDSRGDSEPTLVALRQAREDQAQTLFRAVQELHIATIKNADGDETVPVTDLLAQLAAETETVESTRKEANSYSKTNTSTVRAGAG